MKRLETRWHYSLLSIVLVFLLTMYSTQAPAQIYWNLEIDVPFQFYVVNTKLPSGRYIVHMLDNSDMGAMEIVSADGSTSVFFEVGGAVKADSSRATSELIFNRYGNRYFLEKLTKALIHHPGVCVVTLLVLLVILVFLIDQVGLRIWIGFLNRREGAPKAEAEKEYWRVHR
jgi:hypothetical protein